LPKGHGYQDDVFSTAYLGLIDSVETYDPKKGSFRAHAKPRIRGAIVDGMRSFERHERQVWRIARVRIEAEKTFEQEHGRAPSDGELQAILGWTVRKLERSRRKVLILSEIQHRVEDQEKAAPYANTIPDRHDQAADRARGELFDRITKGLTPREKQVLHLYYFEGLNLREAGERLGCCESETHRVLHVALEWLRQARGQSESELWEAARAAGVR
jgi:RNA polymerase sigma factor for flagellar operon FliA